MTINHELWRVVASGGLTLLVNKMQGIAHVDTRTLLNQKRDFISWLRVELAMPTSLSLAISDGTLGLLWSEVQQFADYAPVIRQQSVPMVKNAASDGTTLTADNPGEYYTTYVCRFNGQCFEEVGTLTDNSQPGTGNYVLANKTVAGGVASLPSSFLTIS